MFNKIRFYSFCFCLFISSEILAQENSYYLKPLDNEKLQKFTFTKIYPAKSGKLYLGTTSGLVCFDGSDIKVYTHNENDSTSLSQNHIIDIVEDKKGNLYISTLFEGINYLDIKTGKISQLKIPFSGPSFFVKEFGYKDQLMNAKLFYDEEEILWIAATYNPLCRFDPQKNNFQNISLFPNNEFGTIYDIIQDQKNKDLLWLATIDGIFFFNKKTNALSKKFNPADTFKKSAIISHRINCIQILNDDSLLFGAHLQGIGSYNKNDGVYTFSNIFKDSELLLNNNISKIEKNNSSEYFILSSKGPAYIFNIESNKLSQLSYMGFSNQETEFKDIAKDRFQNLWCIINKKLYVSFATQSLFRTIPIKDKLYKDAIPNVFTGIIWDPVKRNYFASFNESDGIVVLSEDMKMINTIGCIMHRNDGAYVKSLVIDSKKRLWASQGGFLSVFDSMVRNIPGTRSYGYPSNFNLQEFEEYYMSHEKMVLCGLKHSSLYGLTYFNLYNHPCWGIVTDRDMIYTLIKNKCFKINAITLNYDSLPISFESLVIGPVVKMRIDKRNQYLYFNNISDTLKNESYIFQYNLKSQTLKKIIIEQNHRISAFNESSFEIDNFGNIWVATTNGILTYDHQNLKTLRTYERDKGTSIIQLLNVEKHGIMCITTEAGIRLFDYENDKYIDFSGYEWPPMPFQLFVDYANDLFFTSYPGYLQYAPIDSLLNKTENRASYFSRVLIQGKKDSSINNPEDLREIDLDFNQNNLSITISSIEFMQPHRLQYRYILEGADMKWIESDFESRSVSYRNLKPGNYIFRAVLKNSNGTWSNQELNLLIKIKPAYWQTNLFKIAVVWLAAGIGFWFLRWRIKAVRRQEKFVASHEKQLLELESKALRAQMNPHFIFNSLNSIKALINKNENDIAANYLTTFSKLIRTLFQNSNKREVSLFDELETCKHYTQLEKMRFGNKVEFVFSVDESLDLKDIRVPALILQPFIENAIWHGLVPKETNGTVTIAAKNINGAVECIIDDDGIGQELSKQFKAQYESTHESKGIGLTQSRLELDKMLNEREDSFQIIDKKNNDGSPAGTTVIITFKENEYDQGIDN